MIKNLTPELKKHKEDFDFLHKKIGELEWDIATIWFNRKSIFRSEIEMLEDELENYRDNMGILVEKIKQHIANSKSERQ